LTSLLTNFFDQLPTNSAESVFIAGAPALSLLWQRLPRLQTLLKRPDDSASPVLLAAQTDPASAQCWGNPALMMI
jgi:hypothetical protein